MKLSIKVIALLFILAIEHSNTYAQSWDLLGNSGTNSAINFIGTTDPMGLKIRTNSINRIVITSTGKVGIGNFTPSFKFDVRGGSINTDSVYRINGNTVLSIKGSQNAFTGVSSGLSNTTGHSNTFAGFSSGFTNTIGHYNVANGYLALYSNTFASFNTAIGSQALYLNSVGFANSAHGYDALTVNTIGNFNTANGFEALRANSSGSYNCAFGGSAYYTNDTLNNSACIGALSGLVNASNRIELGNTSVSVIAGQVGFSTYSDARIKDNVKEDVPGLAFISKLRPVTYNLNIHRENEMVYKGTKKDEADWMSKYDIEKIKMTGFLAQDVEKAAKETDYDFSGVQKPANPDELYSLRYSDFVMPLVKAVQELNEELKSEVGSLISTNEKLAQRIEKLESLLGANDKYSTSFVSSSTLVQNSPNPFNEQTVIHYFVASQFDSAIIQISDNSNRVLKTVGIKEPGKGELIIHAGEFAAGTYQYSLIVDGNVVNTKQMLLTK